MPEFDLEFDREGNVFDRGQLAAIVAAAPGLTDLIVASHGWNNDMADARQLYNGFFRKVEEVLEGGFVPGLAGRRFGRVLIFWPSKRFADADLIPAGGAAAAAAGTDPGLDRAIAALERDPDRLGDTGVSPARAAALERIRMLVPQLESDAGARREFVLRLREIVDPSQAHPEDGSTEFFTRDPEEMFEEMSKPVGVMLPAGIGGAAGVGAAPAASLGALRDLLGGTLAAARRLLNFTTYYEMKERAGTVGRVGLSQALREIRRAAPGLRLHLIGHSFGGRLVTAAANELDPGTTGVTMTLLQAAYSHNGLSVKFDGTNDGAFRRLVAERRISGPILITHTKNDLAVGIAYPLASRLAFQKAAAFGDENDPYGGMGRNGAQHTPEAQRGELLSVAAQYRFAPAGIFNLRADRVIRDHSDIAHHDIAYAALVAAGTI